MKKFFCVRMAHFVCLSLLVVTVLGLSRASFAEGGSATGTEALRYLPVQDAGRIKPYDTFAREALQLIYGSQKYKSPTGESRAATEIVMTWMLVPTFWDSQTIIEINHRGLKDSLKLDQETKYFSPKQLFENDRIALVMQDLAGQREMKQKLGPYYQAAQRLESQLGLYQSIKAGAALRVVPPTPGAESTANSANTAPMMMGKGIEADRWVAVSELTGELQDKFSRLTRAFIQALPSDPEKAKGAPSLDPNAPSLQQAVQEFENAARAQNPSLYASDRDMAIEVHYNSFHPFMWAWISYLIAAILLGFAWQTGGSSIYRVAWAATAIAFLLHTYGFALRIYLSGHPPVSNMYESVVWVSFGVLVFSGIFEILYRRRFILFAGTVVGVLCLVVADFAPSVLDRSIQPLEPVLRSNYWLTIHVLTITLGYSAFFLAWGLGNVGLALLIKGVKGTDDRIKLMAFAIYRALQVGIVLLAAGTILGGIWADYSWGRFWGWDPKETWAFIALMGYLAVIHGRLVGWVKDIGMMVCAVVAFSLILMAWYGVNFVLGAGLHSYGFGAGGIQYVGGFVAVDLVYVAYALYLNHQLNAKNLKGATSTS
jgi:cytochrome c-type biogenesis protein CcsB